MTARLSGKIVAVEREGSNSLLRLKGECTPSLAETTPFPRSGHDTHIPHSVFLSLSALLSFFPHLPSPLYVFHFSYAPRGLLRRLTSRVARVPYTGLRRGDDVTLRFMITG